LRRQSALLALPHRLEGLFQMTCMPACVEQRRLAECLRPARTDIRPPEKGNKMARRAGINRWAGVTSMQPAFVMFGPAHLTALATILAAALLLAAWARRHPAADRPVRLCLAAALVGGWLGWLLLFAQRGWLTRFNALPLNLCDWAMAALVAALLTKSSRAYVLGYFWGLGGTGEALLTPDIVRGFPDWQFLLFFFNHGAIIATLLYLTLAAGLRPRPRSLPFVVLATFFYALAAGAADYLLGANYGLLLAKPASVTLLDMLSPWPWYIPELLPIGLVSMAIAYAPFFLADRCRLSRRGQAPTMSGTPRTKRSGGDGRRFR
jgi:hypothetical integral membrane protein (TIGR02206 family)